MAWRCKRGGGVAATAAEGADGQTDLAALTLSTMADGTRQPGSDKGNVSKRIDWGRGPSAEGEKTQLASSQTRANDEVSEKKKTQVYLRTNVD